MKRKVRKTLIDFAKNNHWFMKILRIFMVMKGKIKYAFYYIFYNVDKELIVFEAYLGKQYSCSPKALYLELKNNKKYSNFKFVWAFNQPEKFSFLEDNRTKVIKYNSSEYFKTYSKAKYWVTNSRLNEVMKKKKGQVYIQTWHGTPLKKLGYDINSASANAMNSSDDIKRKYTADAKRYDYIVSPSKFYTEKITSAFNLKKINKENIFIHTGYPRNDYLFKYQKEDLPKILKKTGIKNQKKIILYAPTWRDNQHVSGLGYTYELGLNFDELKKELSDEYIILFRVHYLVSNSFDFKKYEGFIYDVSNYDDINELYIISDLLITDYSSVFFDYANLKKPMLFYMYDLEDYQNNLHDFYFDLGELPGTISTTEKELIKSIKEIEKTEKKYKRKYEEFNKKFNYLDDKNSSKRVLNIIFGGKK